MIWGLSLVLILLASSSSGDKIKVPWKMGMKPFTKCISPGKLTTIFSYFFPGAKVTFTWDPKGSHNVEKVNKLLKVTNNFQIV